MRELSWREWNFTTWMLMLVFVIQLPQIWLQYRSLSSLTAYEIQMRAVHQTVMKQLADIENRNTSESAIAARLLNLESQMHAIELMEKDHSESIEKLLTK